MEEFEIVCSFFYFQGVMQTKQQQQKYPLISPDWSSATAVSVFHGACKHLHLLQCLFVHITLVKLCPWCWLFDCTNIVFQNVKDSTLTPKNSRCVSFLHFYRFESFASQTAGPTPFVSVGCRTIPHLNLSVLIDISYATKTFDWCKLYLIISLVWVDFSRYCLV